MFELDEHAFDHEQPIGPPEVQEKNVLSLYQYYAARDAGFRALAAITMAQWARESSRLAHQDAYLHLHNLADVLQLPRPPFEAPRADVA
ncbi:MAG TPA: hypothetical protein VJR27_02185 [Candidatus Saccharimonadales bacterium]|nr:hypothetical protein [Candidatus Saccharimonadales bacterium]